MLFIRCGQPLHRSHVKPDQTDFHHVRGLRLAVHRWGDPTLPQVFFHHGFLDHGQSFAAIAALISPRWHVIALDARGHGESDWIGAGGYYHFADFWHDLDLLLAHYQPAHVVGHSMGGMITTAVLAVRPGQIQSLTLLDGMGPPESPVDIWPQRLENWLDSLLVPGYTGDIADRRASRRPMPTVEDAAARLATTNTEPVAGGLVWRHDPLHRTPTARPFRTDEALQLWQKLAMPVLSIYAQHSQWLPPDLAARHASVPRLHAGVLADTSHNLHHEQPAAIAHLLESWWNAPGQALPEGLLPGEPGR
jgi:pimeloyl-ACP methyl ester carboxylesterase